ncbi:MAG: hypothetical protein MJ250_08325 [Alphaproteobacteria bacterium]|nr:hypothetical protein [Alphaproteobacteria bacterium]
MKKINLIAPVLASCLIGACSSSETKYYTGNESAQAYNDAVSIKSSPAENYGVIPEGQIVKLKAESIKFISGYNAPKRLPNVDHLMLVHPEQMLYQWATNRYGIHRSEETAGMFVRFLIKDASIVGRKIVTGGSMSKKVHDEYSAKMDVTVQLVDQDGIVQREIIESASDKVVVPQDVSDRERESAWLNLTIDTIRLLSNRLDQQLQSPTFNDFLFR